MFAQAFAAVAVALLGASGVTKIIDPLPSAGALRQASLPSSPSIARLLGGTEIAISILALGIGGIWVGLAGLMFGAFTIFLLVAMVRDLPIQSCGCFGKDDTPPTVTHVVFNTVAMISLFVAARGSSGLIDWSVGPVELLLVASFLGAGAYAAYLLLAELPRLRHR